MVQYGPNSTWRFNVKSGEHIDLYTGKIIEEDDISIKISTIKDEVRVFLKENIITAKMYERNDNGDNKTTY